MHVSGAVRVCSFALLLLNCGGGDQTDVSEPITELSLVTFNAALGVGLAPYLEQRLDALERDLPGLAADVVCLQEVWQPENIERLVTSLAAEFPYSLRSVRQTGGGGAACTQAEAERLSGCLTENCAGVERDGLPLCAIANCAEAFTQVSMTCQQCIASNQSATDVENLASVCSADLGAASFADQTGLLILSALPLEDLGYFAFESALGDRGLLSARLATDFMGDVDLHCTHLAATLSEVPYTGIYGSWQGERIRQIDQMLERVASVRPADGAAILLGDMNCGPETPLARSASPDAFARFAAAGFEAPYAEADGRCTFCGNNPLNGGASELDEGALIDHVLVSPTGARSQQATRVFDDVMTIDVGGAEVETAHSDHYGVRVSLAASVAATP
jgi:endonuclease/exonuclease/phosphatase family metal-dependent hydrolase